MELSASSRHFRVTALCALSLALVGGIAEPAWSATTNTTLASALANVPAATQALGIQARVNYASVDGGAISIGMEKPNVQTDAALSQALGVPVTSYELSAITSAVRVDKTTSATARPQAAAATVDGFDTSTFPLNDHGSIMGGDRVVSSQGSYTISCTVSELATNGTTKFMATAGHCGKAGTTWSQGYGGTTFVTMKPATMRHWADKDVDELALPIPRDLPYNSNYGAQFAYETLIHQNTKAGTAGDSFPMDGSFTASVGSSVCSDGSFTGWSCGANVTAVQGCAYIFEDENHNGTVDAGERPYVCGMNQARSTTGKRIVTPGDSGGPVVSELNANRHVNLVGTISGGSDDGLHLFYIDWTQAKAQTGWYLEKTNYSMLSSGS